MGSNQFGIKALSISLFILIFTATGLAADPNLVAHWPLDGDATDSSGYAHHGTVYGDPSWIAGVVGSGAIQLDGVDDYIEIEGYKGITGLQARSVSAWINADTSTDGVIINWGDSSIAGGRWRFKINTGGQLRISAKGGYAIATTDLRGTGWRHVAVVLPDDGTVTTAGIQFYVDGVLDPTSDALSVAINTTDMANVTLGTSSAAILPFKGMIDDMRIYDWALTQAEIAELADVSIGPFLAVPDNSFFFVGVESQSDTLNQTLTVQNAGDGTVHWLVDMTGKPAWLTITPTNGALTQQQTELVTLSVDVNGLSVGNYSYTFNTADANALNSPQTVMVQLFITNAVGDIYVPADYSTIQAAIDASVNGDTITVSPGTYVENINFNGKDIILTSSKPADQNVVEATIIDGNAAGSVVTFAGSETSACELRGFTITNGYVTGSYPLGMGGGIYGNSTHATIADCTITGNTADSGGGLVFCDGSITDCTITGNTAGSGGGLVFCNGSITNCRISGNTADNFGGGGLYDCDASITNCMISGNTAKIYGGGLGWCDGPITNCTITGNTAEEFGGGLSKCDGLIINCTIIGNAAEDYGGGLYWCDGPITSCTISGNTAEEYGGGLGWCDGPITNCIISGNWANNGGGLYGGGGDNPYYGAINNCTVTGNSANNTGGLSGYNGSISNSIVWGNSSGQVFDSSIPTYSCIQDWTGGGEGNISVDPLFADTTSTDPAQWDLHLLPGSPCIDAGTNSPPDGLAEFDLDGNPRVIDDQVDMGAYEYQNERPIANAGDEQTVYAWVDGSAEVVLDGTGSTDADGDALVYFWYNDAGELIAEGAEPEVVLEVGEHVITLIVNDGIEDSEPDSCIVTVVEVLEGDARVLPRVFNQKRHSDKIIGWLSLPEGIGADALDPYESMRLLPGDIEPMWQRILPAGRGRHPRAGIVAIYAADLLRDELTANTSQDITLVVKLESGQFVYGTDSIRVIDPKPKVPKKHEKGKSR